MNYEFSPSQLVNYYPKYEYLDGLLSATSLKKMNLFIDFKGCCQSLFQEWSVNMILENTKFLLDVELREKIEAGSAKVSLVKDIDDIIKRLEELESLLQS